MEVNSNSTINNANNISVSTSNYGNKKDNVLKDFDNNEKLLSVRNKKSNIEI